MKSTWSSSRGGEGGRAKFMVDNNPSADGEEINTFIALDMYKALQINNKFKAKAMDESDVEEDLEYFKF